MLQEAWAAGNLTSASVDGTVQLNAQSIGEALAYNDVIEWITKRDA